MGQLALDVLDRAFPHHVVDCLLPGLGSSELLEDADAALSDSELPSAPAAVPAHRSPECGSCAAAGAHRSAELQFLPRSPGVQRGGSAGHSNGAPAGDEGGPERHARTGDADLVQGNGGGRTVRSGAESNDALRPSGWRALVRDSAALSEGLCRTAPAPKASPRAAAPTPAACARCVQRPQAALYWSRDAPSVRSCSQTCTARAPVRTCMLLPVIACLHQPARLLPDQAGHHRHCSQPPRALHELSQRVTSGRGLLGRQAWTDMRFADGRLEARFSRWQAPALASADRVHGALLAAGHAVALLARLLLPAATMYTHGAGAHAAGAQP